MKMDYIGFYEKHVSGLERKGREYVGWCPFHSDEGSKMKGFSVNGDTGLWYCFSCGFGGNAIQFCERLDLDKKKAPDYDPKYEIYSYKGGACKKKPKDREKNPFWEGPEDARNNSPYNQDAVKQAKKQRRTLWICEGEKDTLTMLLGAGELAIGIPSATSDKVLEDISLVGIPEVIIACDNDDTGKRAAKRILDRFPFALPVEWPEDAEEGFDVTDLREEQEENFVGILKEWAVDTDPFDPLEKFLRGKQRRDKKRDPEQLLGHSLERFKSLAKNLDGIQPGFYVVGAETNAGKTAFLCNLTLDLLNSNDNLAGLYFSLDDNKEVIVNRFLSIQSGVPLVEVQKKQSSERREERLEKAYKDLMELAKEQRLFVRDAKEIMDIEALEQEIKRRMNREPFVVVDGLYNLDTGSESADLRKENIERANRLKVLADTYRIPLVCTGELRKTKVGSKERGEPSIHDLMETGKFAYNANLVLLIYPASWEEYENQDEPIMIIKYAKNKLSHFRGSQRVKFHRLKSRMEEK
jgi:replicative DNA helicase